jgi:peptidoglycan/LPS O-acetylase OafA/YrhL
MSIADRPTQTDAVQTRFAQLDGLRAIAVAAVLVDHSFTIPWVGQLYFWTPGAVGVRLFFVLSGFLITGILLQARWTTGERPGAIAAIWRAFYLRRALRIVPLAYLAIAVAWMIRFPAIRDGGWWYLAYASNIRASLPNVEWDSGLGHFWSLAVEEQFYLIWPAILLLIPRRHLLAAMVVAVLAAGAMRGLLFEHGQFLAAYLLSPARFDALAAGGLLALLLQRGHPMQRLVGQTAAVGAGLLVLGVTLPHTGLWAVADEWAAVALSGAAILGAARGYRGLAGRVLQSRLMVYLGTISYGIYVIHYPIPRAASHIHNQVWLHLFEHGVSRLLLVSALSIALAAISWHWFEKPINDLKRHVPYIPEDADLVASRRDSQRGLVWSPRRRVSLFGGAARMEPITRRP